MRTCFLFFIIFFLYSSNCYSEISKKFSTQGYLTKFPAWQMLPGGRLGFLGNDFVDYKSRSVKGRFQVALFDPEQLALLSQKPSLIPKYRWKFISKPGSTEDFNVMDQFSTGGSHIAVGFDPRFAEGPITIKDPNSCRLGKFDPPEDSTLECYRLILFFPKQTPEFYMDGKDERVRFVKFEILQSEIAIVIDKAIKPVETRNPIILAEFVTSPPYYSPVVNNLVAPRTTLEGFTLTVTSDSRLLFFAPPLLPNSAFQGIQFVFNEKPWLSSNWGLPRKLTELYTYAKSKDRDENAHICLDPTKSRQDCDPQQRARFSDRYSLSKFPLRSADGTFLPEKAMTFCSYPWVTPDGSEMFCQMFRNNGTAVVGRRTGGTFKLLDGFLNQQDNMGDFGDGHHRISSLGTGSGVWSAYPGAKLDFPFPLTGKNNKQTLLVKTLGNNIVYGEVDMNDFMDGGYLLYLPFNQMVEYCGGFCEPSGRTFRPVPSNNIPQTTPDTSGFFHKATINPGASFSKEIGYGSLPADNFQGRSIDFQTGSYVEVVVPPKSQLSMAQPNYTIQFAIKPNTLLTGDGVVGIAVKDGSWGISLSSGNRLRITGNTGKELFEFEVPVSLPMKKWSHVSIEFIPFKMASKFSMAVNVYLDGLRYTPPNQAQSFVPKLKESPTRYALVANNSPIQIGPKTAFKSASNIRGIIYSLDEFSISRVRRTQEEIELAAHLIPGPTEFISDFTQLGNKVGNNVLPKGLKAHELRIPVSLKDYLNNSDAINLGKRLFEDKNLSKEKTISCSTCHQQSLFFTDGKTVPTGGNRNTPTVLNRAFSTRQFSNGRSSNLVDQALQPIINPNEMDNTMAVVLAYLNNDQGYKNHFYKVFKSQANNTSVALALATYEISLLSGDSQVDNLSSSNEQVQRGKIIFEGKGRCMGCHSGSNYSDELFHNTGVSKFDTQTFDHVKRFKTPTLRNIAQTSPYFHDGSKTSLEEVIDFYNQGGGISNNPFTSPELVPLGLSDTEKEDLKAFLKALTGSGN